MVSVWVGSLLRMSSAAPAGTVALGPAAVHDCPPVGIVQERKKVPAFASATPTLVSLATGAPIDTVRSVITASAGRGASTFRALGLWQACAVLTPLGAPRRQPPPSGFEP